MDLTVETSTINQEGTDSQKRCSFLTQKPSLLACPTAGTVTQARVFIHPHIVIEWILLLTVITFMTMTISGIYCNLLSFSVFAKCCIFLSDLSLISTLWSICVTITIWQVMKVKLRKLSNFVIRAVSWSWKTRTSDFKALALNLCPTLHRSHSIKI